MMKVKRLLILALTFLSATAVRAQELNCTVSVINPQVQLVNRDALDNMQNSIRDFMNNKRWTNESITPAERIDCNIQINVQNLSLATGEFSGTIQVSASRPAYGTTYSSSTLNFLDKNFAVKYITGQQMDFIEGTYTNELTSILAYYAYIIIGYDFDSFSELGGTPYFQKAMSIANAAQPSGVAGWSAQEKNERNRYFLVNELMSEQYKVIRQSTYKYYRQGLDMMITDNEKGLKAITEVLETLKESRRTFPNLGITKMFFEAKMNELIDLFSEAPAATRCTGRQLLMETDVTNANRYADRIPC